MLLIRPKATREQHSGKFMVSFYNQLNVLPLIREMERKVSLINDVNDGLREKLVWKSGENFLSRISFS
jgi:hypothetical protein